MPLLLALFMLSACGGEQNPASPASGSAKPQEVNIGTQQLPNDEMIAIIKGYYEEEMGVPVNIMNFEAGDIRNAMMAGDIDFAMLGSSSAILGKANGMDVSLVWIHEIIGTSEQLVAHENSDIYKMEDLRGKTVAAPFTSTAHYSLLKALTQHARFSPDDTLVKCVSNRVTSGTEGQQLFNKINAVVQRYLKLPMTYLGAIPQDNQLQTSVMQQTPVSIMYPNAQSVRAFENIAAQLTGAGTEEQVQKRGMAAFFSYIVQGRKLASTTSQ